MSDMFGQTIYFARSINDLRAEFDRGEIDVLRVLSTVLDMDSCPAVMITGSLAEGLATPRSDVDVLVLLDNEEALRIPVAAPAVESSRPRHYSTRINGVALDFELAFREPTAPLQRAFVQTMAALYVDSAPFYLPQFHPADIRFLHDLRTGWIYGNEDEVQKWRTWLQVDELPRFLTLWHLAEHLRYMADVAVRMERPVGGLQHLIRLAAESALLSVLAAEGHTNPERKWILHHKDQLAEGTAKQLADRLVRCMFPRRVTSPAEIEHLQAACSDLSVETVSYVTGKDRIMPAGLFAELLATNGT